MADENGNGVATLEDSLLQNETYSWQTIQQSHCLVFIQRSWKLTSTQKPAIRWFTADLFFMAKTWTQ